MADEIDVMGLLRSLQQENAKNKLSRKDISQSILRWYVKMMGFIQVDNDKFELRGFGVNTPFKFTSIMPHDSCIALMSHPHPDNNQYPATEKVMVYSLQTLPSLSLKQSCVEKDVKKLRDELRKLHSILRKLWENIEDDILSEEETE